MGSLGNPKPWVPYMNTKDCSQGFCSLYCPQWCYAVFPPPPPFELSTDNSGPNFSPLIIAIIGILASAFLLVSYYAIISKFCGNTDSARRRENNHDPNLELEEIRDPSNHEPWHVATHGLDEALIKSITVFKYKNGDGLIEGTDCSVCLSEFQENENLRLLPKCSHAFHVKCIDTWLGSHSNCPLCRANICCVNTLPPQLPPPVTENPTSNEMLTNGYRDTDSGEEEIPTRAPSNLGNTGEIDAIIEIREDECEQQIRRSVSMSNLCQARVSIADVLCIYQDDEDCGVRSNVGSSSKSPVVETRKSSYINIVPHCVTNPGTIKRSFSGGRFLYPKRGRGHNIVIPF